MNHFLPTCCLVSPCPGYFTRAGLEGPVHTDKPRVSTPFSHYFPLDSVAAVSVAPEQPARLGLHLPLLFRHRRKPDTRTNWKPDTYDGVTL